MKKVIVFVVIALLAVALSSCTPIPDVNGGNDNDDNPIIVDYGENIVMHEPKKASTIGYNERENVIANVLRYMLPYAERFSTAVLAASGNKNIICSPLTAYFCLALAGECTAGVSQSEILSALGFDSVEQLRVCMDMFYNASMKESVYYDKIVSKEIVTNSLWIDPEIACHQATIDALTDSHHAFVVDASFSKHNAESNKAVNDFVYAQSNKLLKTNFNFDEFTKFLLMSTMYVKDMWDMGDVLNYTPTKRIFTNHDGTLKEEKLLDSGYMRGQLLETETFKAMPVTSHSGYKLYFIVPQDNVDINDVMSGNTISRVITNEYKAYEGEMRYETKVLFPEFSVENNFSLLNAVRSMGIVSAFDDAQADLSGLLVDSDDVYFKEILQANKLKVDKSGFEGASVTVMISGVTSIGPTSIIYNTITVDRSFGFVLADTYNMPLFSGIIYNI